MSDFQQVSLFLITVRPEKSLFRAKIPCPIYSNHRFFSIPKKPKEQNCERRKLL